MCQSATIPSLPRGDPDCRLGCKRRSNTPPSEATPASDISSAEFYWGYASGVVATHLADGTEVVLAELTQTFDAHDVTYFQPLMADTERRLGRRPRFGALDAAFDAFYVYGYFDQAGGFAAVPFVARGGVHSRQFDPDGNPICAAGQVMALSRTFLNRTSYVEHERGVWKCPLLGQADCCPVDHDKWPKGGCQITMATAPGAHLRYQIDRASPAYKAIYNQRTATERINSQATELGIEPAAAAQRSGHRKSQHAPVCADQPARARARAGAAGRGSSRLNRVGGAHHRMAVGCQSSRHLDQHVIGMDLSPSALAARTWGCCVPAAVS